MTAMVIVLVKEFTEILRISCIKEVLGFSFSLNYVKTKNIASNIFLHCAWNTMAVILTVLSSL